MVVYGRQEKAGSEQLNTDYEESRPLIYDHTLLFTSTQI
jgi:hypothetical protein